MRKEGSAISTRYIVIGAGAVGATVAAELDGAGLPVVVVARGANLEALRSRGLHYIRPDSDRWVALDVAGGPDEVELHARLHGLDAPVNAGVQQRIARAACTETPPGSLGEVDLAALLASAGRRSEAGRAGYSGKTEVLVDAKRLHDESGVK